MSYGSMMGQISNSVAKKKGLKVGVKNTTYRPSRMAEFEDKSGKGDQGAGKQRGAPHATGNLLTGKGQAGGRIRGGGNAGRESVPGTDGPRQWPKGGQVKKSNRGNPKVGKGAPQQPSGPLYGGPNSRP